jgi:hypothetical protein
MKRKKYEHVMGEEKREGLTKNETKELAWRVCCFDALWYHVVARRQMLI